MKNIFKLLFVFFAAGTLLVSCDKETNFESLTKDLDPNANYYLQFVDAVQSLSTGVTEEGDLVEIETTISVALLGQPQSADIVVEFIVEATNTIDPSMFTMSGNSITIPAGKTSGSVTLTTVAANMPVGETLKFAIKMDEGEHDSPSVSGTKIDYNLKRIQFCPWSVDDMVGTYTGSETNAYGINIESGAKFEVFKVDDTHIAISGLFQSIYGPGYWGETPTAGDRPVFEYKGNGFLLTEKQLILETDGVWEYFMSPGDKDITWDGCNMSFNIPFFFHWDSGYSDNVPFLVTMTKNGKKRANVNAPKVEVTLKAPVK